MFMEFPNANNDSVAYIIKEKVVGLALEDPKERGYISNGAKQLRIDCRGGKSYYSGWLPLDQAEALRDKVLNQLNK